MIKIAELSHKPFSLLIFLVTLVILYSSSLHHVGVFPRETPMEQSTYCVKGNGTPEPFLSLQNRKFIAEENGSDALWTDIDSGRIFATDVISVNEILALKKASPPFEEKELNAFIEKSFDYFSPCLANPLPSQNELIENYWASKGSSVLHHWAYFAQPIYSGIGETEAHFGYLLPILSKSLASVFFDQGATYFVKTAWGLLFICSCLYVIALYKIFKRIDPATISIYISLGFLLSALIPPFLYILNPGFHWQRDLVLLTTGPILWKIYQTNKKERMAWAALAALLFLIEPIFLTLAFVASIIAISLSKFDTLIIKNYYKAHRLIAIIAISFIALLAFILAMGPLEYIFGAFKHLFESLNFKDGEYTESVFFYTLILATISFITLLSMLRILAAKDIAGLYFGITAIFGTVYFLTMPDRFHFAKSLGFFLPFLMTQITHFGTLSNLSSRQKYFITLTILTVAVLVFFWTGPRQARVESLDNFFSQFESHNLGNGRFDGRIPEDMAVALSEITQIRPKYFISPHDKYYLLAGGIASGFKAADMLHSIPRKGVQYLSKRIMRDDGGLVAIEKTDDFFKISNGVKASHKTLYGIENKSGNHSLRSRLNGQQLIKVIENKCKFEEETKKWKTYRCT